MAILSAIDEMFMNKQVAKYLYLVYMRLSCLYSLHPKIMIILGEII